MYLTKKQSAILDYLKSYDSDNGFTPTFEEIARHFGFKSKGTVYKHINALKTKGVIKQAWNRVRGIEIVDTGNDNSLPVLGVVAAGQPIAAVENREDITVPPELLGSGEHFILRVSGDSMLDQHIADGDYVVIRRKKTARSGDTVVALIDKNDATIKTYYDHEKQVELRPAHPEYKSLFVDRARLSIDGIVVGVLRKY